MEPENRAGEQAIRSISISPRFDLSIRRGFMRYVRDESNSCRVYKINLKDVEYLDSSALGMLLILKEHAELKRSHVVLCSPSEPAKQMFDMVGFDRLFESCTQNCAKGCVYSGAIQYPL